MRSAWASQLDSFPLLRIATLLAASSCSGRLWLAPEPWCCSSCSWRACSVFAEYWFWNQPWCSEVNAMKEVNVMNDAAMNNAVVCTGVEKSFGQGETRIQVLRQLDLSIEMGGLAMLVG